MRLGDRALIGPQVVQLDLTDACTNNCLGCWARSPLLHDEDHYDTLAKGALDLPFVRRLLPTLRELRVRELFLGGGGDPLCHDDVVEVIRAAKQHGLTVSLNTNLTLADPALIDALIDAGLDLLIVSIWAGNAATYSRLHPNKTAATFDHLTRLLQHLRDRKNATGRATPRVKLYEVISTLNFEQIPQMVAHGREVGAEEVELAVFDPIPRRTDHFTLNKQQIARTLEIVEALPTDAPPFVHTELFTRRLQNIDATKGVFDNGIVASIPCAAGWFYSRVTTVGQVHACLKAHRVAVGDLREHDLGAVWFGDGMKTFRKHTLRVDHGDPWLSNIGHDIDFALPGCFRTCDNLGHNQHIMKLEGGLTAAEKQALDAMEKAARAGRALHEIEDEYRRCLRPEPETVPPFSPPVDAAPTLHGDIDLIHQLAPGAAPWDDIEADLRDIPPGRTIRVPVTLWNVARLDRIFALIAHATGRNLDPETVRWSPRPLADLHRRVPAILARAKEVAAREHVALDLDDGHWRDALWKIAGAVRDDNQPELLRALGALTGVAFVGPRTFHLDVTNRCEADCAYCWFHSPLAEARTDPHRLTDANRDAMMSWEMFVALADDLATLETREDIVLSGKGDPLVHPRIADMVRELKARGLTVTLFTGGVRLDDALIDAFLDAELDMLYVSLSAADETTFTKLHTKLAPTAHGRIVAAVRQLLDRRRARGLVKPRVVLVDVLTNRNDEQVVDFARLAAELGVDHVRYQMAAIEDYNTALALDAKPFAALADRLAEAKRIAAAAGVEVIDNIDFQTGGHGEGGDWTGDRYARLGCLAGYVFGRAWADGMLSFCCAPRPIGTLAERGFAQWWRGDAYDRVRLAARRLGDHTGLELTDGTTLWTDVCRRCPNYEGIERVRRVLGDLGLLELLP